MSKRTDKRQSAAGRLPVIELPAECFGELGITLGRTDAGGGNGQGHMFIPIREVKWMDERQLCKDVLAFVHAGNAPDLPGCVMYRAGKCGLMHEAPCAFHEGPDAEIWQQARNWQRKDGAVIHRDLWAEYGLTDAGKVTP